MTLLIKKPKYYNYDCVREKLENAFPGMGTDVEKETRVGFKMDWVMIYHTFPNIKEPIPFIVYEPNGRRKIKYESLVGILNRVELKIADFAECA
ncbi:hypothetical protein [Leptospira sp. GIMC2001]|uniref:hypothetical protein n=1 Tax=Leptospira sp. GIMC2001 TaxID=1513297 RepID=UPI00234B3CBE|nr:hypothetical protein [Leptospira sp. GIMC2001]WCL51477.1 hypothetical protein O4O04_20385 [Leptospira sp. GIMC2001]